MSARRAALTVADLRMETVTRMAAGAALLVVAASFTFSFAQITWVSSWALGPETAWLNYLLPLIIDAPALIASALTVALHDREPRLRAYAWTVLVVFTAASWVCNAVHATMHSALPAAAGGAWWAYALVVLIAGFPPIGVVLGVHIWAFALRHSPTADQRAPRERPGHAQARSSALTPSVPARMPAQPVPAERAPADLEPARAVAVPATGAQNVAKRLYADLAAERPGERVDAAVLRRRLLDELGLADDDPEAPNASTVRRWRNRYESDAQLHVADPDPEPDVTVGERSERIAV